MAEVVLHMVRDDEMAFIRDERLERDRRSDLELDKNAVNVEDFDPEKEPEAVAEPENARTEGAETESEPVEMRPSRTGQVRSARRKEDQAETPLASAFFRARFCARRGDRRHARRLHLSGESGIC
ncbi:MAG: hypothetical protein IPJ30_08720 [Acidobacteria bacterium]|nr:hypothetical protein [Acidobacteriota bacterium]